MEEPGHSLVHSLTLLTHLLAPPCLLRLRPLLRSLARSLAHFALSLARGKMNDSMSKNDLVLSHSARISSRCQSFPSKISHRILGGSVLGAAQRLAFPLAFAGVKIPLLRRRKKRRIRRQIRRENAPRSSGRSDQNQAGYGHDHR